MVLGSTFAAVRASAEPVRYIAADEPKWIDWKNDRAVFEWSTWIGLGYGMEHTQPSDPTAARTTSPTPPPETRGDYDQMLDARIGADVTFPVPTQRVRLGPWVERQGRGTFVGAELNIAGGDLDMFLYEGEKVYSLRAGASETDISASFAFGYRCPWKLWGPYNATSRYMIGARLVANYTQSRADSHDWNASLGLEFEPVGALRYIGGIRSWY